MTCNTSAVAVCCSSASSRSAVRSASRRRSAAFSRSSSAILSAVRGPVCVASEATVGHGDQALRSDDPRLQA